MTQSERKAGTVREAVGVFHDADSLQNALDELQEKGFPQHYISVLANAEAVEKKLGHVYHRVKEEEDDPKAPRTIFVPSETIGEAETALVGFPLYVAAATATAMVVASGGTLLSAIVAAAAAGTVGGAFGGLYAWMVGEHHAGYIQQQIEHGGLLLWVQTDDEEHEKRAVSALKKYSADDVHVHDIPVGN